MQAEMNLLIRAALLANLPRSGSVWPEEERQEWLRFAETLFKLVYWDEDRAENKPARRNAKLLDCRNLAVSSRNVLAKENPGPRAAGAL